MSIILKTHRLYLREINEADLVLLAEIYADELCMQFYPATKTITETAIWFKGLAFDSYKLNGFGLWAVVDSSTGQLVGDCGITLQQTPEGKEPEIGYHIRPEFWGQGLATEAALGCREYAFKTLGMGRVVSITSPENIPSQRVAQRVHDRKEIYQKRLSSNGPVVQRYLYISENK